MNQKTLSFIIILYCGFIYSQDIVTMRGEILAKVKNRDTINFNTGFVNKYFFETL